MHDTPVTLAVIIGAHGVAGEVRLKSFADGLANYRSFNGGKLTLNPKWLDREQERKQARSEFDKQHYEACK